ncbi:hypothetical protein ACFQZT_10405 [Paenibacillus sp. GCM10027628]|uniref:hypothetical protein n=1 Tax=Paenibacillus sp. GCM10027628 TaxID=3273413 RepID=UPI00362FD99C
MITKFRKGTILGLVCGIAITATSVASAFLQENDSDEPTPPPVTASEKEKDKYKKELLAWAEKNNKITYLTPEKTKGSKIKLNGKDVQLPEDAFLDGLLVSYDSQDFNQKDLPGLVIKRGSSDIVVNPNSGKVLMRNYESHLSNNKSVVDSEPFDFLKGIIVE